MIRGLTVLVVAWVAGLGAAHSQAQATALTQSIEAPTPASPHADQPTAAKQLAQYVVLCSRTQRAVELPGSYARHPEVLQFISAIPADWSDTRVLNREAGGYLTIVRKDRHSEDWYLGAITHEQPRILRVRLDFLDADQRYRATIYRDGPGVTSGQGEEMVIESRPVSRFDHMQLSLAAHGGLAMRITSEPIATAPLPSPPASPKRRRPPPEPQFDVE